jgi:hypothetical protein
MESRHDQIITSKKIKQARRLGTANKKKLKPVATKKNIAHMVSTIVTLLVLKLTAQPNTAKSKSGNSVSK